MDCSFWIESKRFVFSRKGGNSFCNSEKSRKIVKSLFLSREMVVQMAKVMEDYSRHYGHIASYHTKREGE